MIVKSSRRCRMYLKAASSDSAATQYISGGLSSLRYPGGPVSRHNWASHAPLVPGRNRVFWADFSFSFFVRRRLFLRSCDCTSQTADEDADATKFLQTPPLNGERSQTETGAREQVLHIVLLVGWRTP